MSGREVADGVFLLTVPMSEHLSTAVVALRGRRTTLVDAGTPGDGPAMVTECINARGLAAPDAVLITHFHRDHTGGIAELQRAAPLDVYAHVAETGSVACPAEFGQALYRNGVGTAPPVGEGVAVTGVLDGFLHSVGGREWEAIHVPGHSWGHLAFWSASDRILIAGDAIQGAGVPFRGVPGQGTGLAYYLDVGAYRRSLERMRALDPAVLILSHGISPWNKQVLDAPAAIRAAFTDSLENTSRLEDIVRDCLASGIATLQEISAAVCLQAGTPTPTPQSMLSVHAHLSDLRSRRMATLDAGRWKAGPVQ